MPVLPERAASGTRTMMTQVTSLSLLAGLALAFPAGSSAQANDHDIQCNANGYVLTPAPSAKRQYSNGKLMQSALYLGISCDAYIKNLGDGHWCWANAGVLTEFDGEVLALTRYELPDCKAHPSEYLCGCWDNPLPSMPTE